jgi:hypothetical protein
VPTQESEAKSTTQSTDGFEKNGPIPKKLLAELYILLYNGGLWEHLTDDGRKYGESVLQEMMDTGVQFKAPEPRGMSLSISEYLQIIKRTLNIKGLDSDFWQIVVKIQYLMMSIEKDPILAQKFKDQTDMNNYVFDIFGEMK